MWSIALTEIETAHAGIQDGGACPWCARPIVAVQTSASSGGVACTGSQMPSRAFLESARRLARDRRLALLDCEDGPVILISPEVPPNG